MKNKKLEKIVIKLSIGGFISLLLGTTYKLGKELDETVDEKYEKEHGVKKDGWF